MRLDSGILNEERLQKLCDLQDRLGKFFDNFISGNVLDEIRLTTNEAAAFLGITPNALRIKVHRRKVEAETLDGSLRFKLSSLLSSFKKLED